MDQCTLCVLLLYELTFVCIVRCFCYQYNEATTMPGFRHSRQAFPVLLVPAHSHLHLHSNSHATIAYLILLESKCLHLLMNFNFVSHHLCVPCLYIYRERIVKCEADYVLRKASSVLVVLKNRSSFRSCAEACGRLLRDVVDGSRHVPPG